MASNSVTAEMLRPSNELALQGLTLIDPHRLPTMAYRGETLHINPVALKTSREWGDRIAKSQTYDVVTNPSNYAAYGAEPVGHGPLTTKLTPVDILTQGIETVLLHEVGGNSIL